MVSAFQGFIGNVQRARIRTVQLYGIDGAEIVGINQYQLS